MSRVALAGGLAALLLLSACASGGSTGSSAAETHGASSHGPSAVEVADLEPGERWIDLGLPGGTYTPEAEAGGTDDYRCILLDPALTDDAFLSGVVLEPGNPELVHHAILYRVDPDQVSAAKANDAADPTLGLVVFRRTRASGSGWGDRRAQRRAVGGRASPRPAVSSASAPGTGHGAVRRRARRPPDALQPPARGGYRQHAHPAAGRSLPAPTSLHCARSSCRPLSSFRAPPTSQVRSATGRRPSST